eukprot:COSAG04_NODE_405_length_14870_cov_4.008666_11_plen_84_part_00
MEPAALASVAAVFGLLFLAVIPRWPIAGIALTALGPFCPMPAAICGWLGLSRCDGALMDLELELPHPPPPPPIPPYPLLARGV